MRWPRRRRRSAEPVTAPLDTYGLQLAALRERLAEDRWDTYRPDLDCGIRSYFMHRVVLRGDPYVVLVSPDARRVIRMSVELDALLGMRPK